jgi:hypothetical protein
MDKKSLLGSISIVIMFLGLIYVINVLANEIYTKNTFPITIAVIIVVGFINGLIFGEKVSQAITNIVIIGEILVVFLFFILYFGFQNDFQNIAGTDLEGLGLILMFVILLAFLIGGFIGFLVFGVVIYIPAMIGKRFNKSS